jgi:hypothetical protein
LPASATFFGGLFVSVQFPEACQGHNSRDGKTVQIIVKNAFMPVVAFAENATRVSLLIGAAVRTFSPQG